MSTWRWNIDPSLIITENPSLQALWFHFLVLTEALWAGEKGQIKQPIRSFFLKAKEGLAPNSRVLGAAFSPRHSRMAPSASGFFLISPSLLPTAFLCRVFELQLWAHFCIAHLRRLKLSKELNKTEPCQLTETLSGKQFTHLSCLTAPWNLTFYPA